MGNVPAIGTFLSPPFFAGATTRKGRPWWTAFREIGMSEDREARLPLKITAAMITAGVVILQESGRLSFEDEGSDRALVDDLLRASIGAYSDSGQTTTPPL